MSKKKYYISTFCTVVSIGLLAIFTSCNSLIPEHLPHDEIAKKKR